MANIFENAKFGDKFVTRDGRIAIYAYKHEGRHYLIVEYYEHIFSWNDNGVSDAPVQKLDIVSEWQEPINDEELDNMATLYRNEVVKSCNYNKDELCFLDIDKAYIAGYRAAKKQP